MAGTFPPDYFSPDYFAPDYFGAEADGNAMSASIAGTSSVTATISVATDADQDYDSHWHYAREKKKARQRKTKAQPVVIGVLAAKIVGRSSVLAVGAAPRVCVPVGISAIIGGTSELSAAIEGPDRIEEQDMQDISDLLDLYEILLAA